MRVTDPINPRIHRPHGLGFDYETGHWETHTSDIISLPYWFPVSIFAAFTVALCPSWKSLLTEGFKQVEE